MTIKAKRQIFGDWIFRLGIKSAGLLLVALLGIIFVTLVVKSFPSLNAFGLSFFYTDIWDPLALQFGAKVFLVGTLLTAFIALIISVPFALSLSLFLGEYSKNGFFNSLITSVINILAGIPSVIYGFWGLFVLVPWIRKLEISLGVLPYGVGILTAALILAIMIIPYATAIGRDIISMVPNDLKEGAYSLGATHFEVIRYIILPYAKSGLLAGTLLSLGRAIGETMAVTMVIGNSNILPKGIFDPSNTMASVIANEFSEATHAIHVSALIELGLYLFLITTIINAIGKWIITKTEVAHS